MLLELQVAKDKAEEISKNKLLMDTKSSFGENGLNSEGKT